MRDYAKWAPTFWTGETGRQIRSAGRDAQVVAFYLGTCPSSNWIGLYYLPLPTLCHEVGIPLEKAIKTLSALARAASPITTRRTNWSGFRTRRNTRSATS